MTRPPIDPVRRPGLPRPLAAVLAILLVLLASRAPLVATARHGSELTTDEGDLTLMALDRYFGPPLTNTHWPAITNQVLLVPLIGVDYLASGRPRSAGGFAAYAGDAYRSGTHLLVLHRWLVVALTSLATAAFAWTLRSHGVAVMVVAALLLQNVHLITYGTLGLGNGPALAAMIAAVACLLSAGGSVTRRGHALVAGALVGLAVASRNTSVLVLPLLVALWWELGGTPRERARLAGLLLVGAVVGAAPAWTLAALDPIRWLKANLGNFVKVGAPTGALDALRVLLGAAGWWFWAATIAAAAWLIHARRHVAVVVGGSVGFVGAVVVSGRSPLVETRYFDAIVLGAAVVCLLAARDAVARQPLDRRRVASAVTIATASVLAALGWWTAWSRFDASRAGLYPEDRAVAAAVRAPAGGRKLIVDRALLGLLKARTTSASLRTLADDTAAAMRSGEGLKQFVATFRLPPDVAEVFADDLTEKEQGDIVRNRVAALAPPIGEPLEVIACGDSSGAQRYGVTPLSAVPGLLRDGAAGEAILAADSIATLDLRGLTVERLEAGKYVRVTSGR